MHKICIFEHVHIPDLSDIAKARISSWLQAVLAVWPVDQAKRSTREHQNRWQMDDHNHNHNQIIIIIVVNAPKNIDQILTIPKNTSELSRFEQSQGYLRCPGFEELTCQVSLGHGVDQKIHSSLQVSILNHSHVHQFHLFLLIPSFCLKQLIKAHTHKIQNMGG